MFSGVHEVLIIIEVCGATEVARAVVDLVEKSCKGLFSEEFHEEIIDFVWNFRLDKYENEALRAANESPARLAIVYLATLVIVYHIAKLSGCDRETIEQEMEEMKRYFKERG